MNERLGVPSAEIIKPSLVEILRSKPVELFPEQSIVYPHELKERYPGKDIIACDFYVQTIEMGEPTVGGYSNEGITNVDHHAPTQEMARFISSANLAIEYVRENGPASDQVVVINHTDCDSMLSSSIVRGILSPDDRFGAAAIAADHSGEGNPIADLLQSISDLRDQEYSLQQLDNLLNGRPLDPKAQELVDSRHTDREHLREMVEQGLFHRIGSVAYIILDEKVDGGLLPAIVPDAAVVMLAAASKNDPGRWEMRVRLGMAAPQGLTLQTLGIRDIDPQFGGRWNAGANARGGGTQIDPHTYAQLLNEKLIAHTT